MTTPLRFAGAYTPPAGSAVPLRFGTPPGGGGGGGETLPPLEYPLAGNQVRPWWVAPWHPGGYVASPAWALAWGVTYARSRSISMSARDGAQASNRQRSAWRRGAHTWRTEWAAWAAGSSAWRRSQAPWQVGAPVWSNGGPYVPPDPVVPPVEPGCYIPPVGDAVELRFSDPLLRGLWVALRFACYHPALIRVPSQRVYMVTNDVALIRVSDSANIPCVNLSLSLDVESWAWGFTATLPAASIALIEPAVLGEPIEVEAQINGLAVRLLVEGIERDREFGRGLVRLNGRGKTALLDAPYSAIITFDNALDIRTSQQLVDAAMPFGWTVDWGLEEWLVPAGSWSHQGTPLTAAVAVATAGGGYVQPHPVNNEIRILPRYPAAPWAWSGLTPDIELPADVVRRDVLTWVDKPRYNRVYVSGADAGGILAQVTRTGTAGDVLAPMVTDVLTTHADAGRQRGLAVLADTGRWVRVQMRMPVLDATGVIVPGKMVRYLDGVATRLGLVRSVQVETNLARVWQTLGIDVYVG